MDEGVWDSPGVRIAEVAGCGGDTQVFGGKEGGILYVRCGFAVLAACDELGAHGQMQRQSSAI